jgi:hypothetical protein
MNSENTELFKTSDFFLAVVLYSQDIPLLCLESTSEIRRKTFVFQKTENLAGLIAKFWGQELFIEATMLLTAERALKRRLYDEFERSEKEIRKHG